MTVEVIHTIKNEFDPESLNLLHVEKPSLFSFLYKRTNLCWYSCWYYNKKFEWFECNGKGRGWLACLVPLYILLFPILAVITILTVICLAICGSSRDEERMSRHLSQKESV